MATCKKGSVTPETSYSGLDVSVIKPDKHRERETIVYESKVNSVSNKLLLFGSRLYKLHLFEIILR